MFKEFDAFDLALALYHWLQHNGERQTDDKYSDHGVLMEHYRPSRSEEYFDNLDDGVLTVYNMLTDANYKEALEIVLNCKHEG